MKTRNLRWFFSMFVVGAVVAWSGRAVADTWTVPVAGCRVVSIYNPGEWDCPLPNHTPAFAFNGVGTVYFDGYFDGACASTVTLSVVKTSYTGSVSVDQTAFTKTPGAFDEPLSIVNTAGADVWDYVYARIQTSGPAVGSRCRTGVTAEVYGVVAIR